MTAKILDGNKIAKEIRENIAVTIQKRAEAGIRRPGLAVVLVGENPASQVYVTHKRKDCEEVGMVSFAHDLPADTSQEELLDLIDRLNKTESVDGILIQLPLPKHIDSTEIIERIDPKKDVDAFHPYNMGRLIQRCPLLRPCTPHGIMTLLKHTGETLEGKNAVVVGVSNIVGRPMLLELLLTRTTVTACHSRTQNLEEHIKQADIIVAAIGKRGIVKSEWIKPGAIVIDVGMNRDENGKLCGDIDFEKAKEKASWITPVPGGVGPMTRATLLQNTLFAANHSEVTLAH